MWERGQVLTWQVKPEMQQRSSRLHAPEPYRIRSRWPMIRFRPFSVWVSCISSARLCCRMAGTLEVRREGRSPPVSGRSTSRRWFSSAKHRARRPHADHGGHMGSVFPPLNEKPNSSPGGRIMRVRAWILEAGCWV